MVEILFTHDETQRSHEVETWLEEVNVLEGVFMAHFERRHLRVYRLRDEVRSWLDDEKIAYELIKRAGFPGPLYLIAMQADDAVKFRLRWF